MHREWFELALVRELGQVEAPGELWERVSGGKRIRKGVHRSVNAARVSACATIVIGMLLGIVWTRRAEIRSGDAGVIRNWVVAHGGVDVPLRGSVPLMGARVANGVVEIDYKGGRLVIEKGTAGGHHTPRSGSRVFTWSMDGRTYKLECLTPEDLTVA